MTRMRQMTDDVSPRQASPFGRGWPQTFNIPRVEVEYLAHLGEGNKNTGLRTLIESSRDFQTWLRHHPAKGQTTP